jgi:hypothetical protein
MPMAIIRATLQFGLIVKMVAKNGQQEDHSCGGKIEARLDDNNDKIAWKCIGCGENGEISHWRGSGWEDLLDKNTPKLIVATKKSQTRKKTRRATLVLSKRELSALRKVICETQLDHPLSIVRPINGQGFAISLTLRQLDDLYCMVGDLLDFGPSRQRKMWDDVLNTIAWAMDEITFAEVDDKQNESTNPV